MTFMHLIQPLAEECGASIYELVVEAYGNHYLRTLMFIGGTWNVFYSCLLSFFG